MIFLGWNRPFLHAAADWLLDRANVSAAPDLSGTIIVVRGRRAGRRLLELLALKCAKERQILVPPEIMTPMRLISRLTEELPDEPAEASALASTLAWAQALAAADEEERNKLFRRPGAESAGLRALLGLAQHLARIWAEVGGAGLSFADVERMLNERFTDVAQFEAPRWEVLTALQRRTGDILRSRGMMDHTERLLHRARRGAVTAEPRIVLAGVAEMSPILREFIGRLLESPTSLVFAPESEREGFEEPGVLRAGHWNARRAVLEAGQLHLVERDRDQAFRAAQVMAAWREGGLAPTQMTLAVPQPAALPRLREALEGRGVETRWAQGRPAADAPSFQLLSLVADYLDHDPAEPPRYAAVAALVRHPDVAWAEAADWRALDAFATSHLPARFEPESVESPPRRAREIAESLSRWIDLGPEEIEPRAAAEWTRHFLLRVYGEREESALAPFGRVAVKALELLRDVLADTAADRLPWPERIRPADFLHAVLGFLGEEQVPEPPDPEAVEITGWLELLEDDAPAVAVASFHEGAVPETISGDPFLPGSLREALGLGDNAARLARDAYALAAILASRAEGRGTVALLAPRFDAEDNPVRPSRLLLNGLAGEELAQRIWHLAGKRRSETLPSLPEGPGFGATWPIDAPSIKKIGVTAFRDYLASPRRFFFLHVLGLAAANDDVQELHAGHVGTLVHEVLAAFGADARRREETDAARLEAWLLEKMEERAEAQFGRWAQPAVEIQLEAVRRRLLGFARVQPELRRAGWTIRYVEGEAALAFDLVAEGGAGEVRVTGKIDRIDVDASGTHWRIIDYKTSAKGKDPWRAHFAAKRWVDLQLPLYLRLAAPYASKAWGVELTPQNCELVYFQLPDDASTAEISSPFPPEAIEDAWGEAARIAACILRGEFDENPPLSDEDDPALLGLCGQVGIIAPSVAEEQPAEEN